MTDAPNFSDDRIVELARLVDSSDRELIAPPPHVWATIAAELASAKGPARRRAERRWFPST